MPHETRPVGSIVGNSFTPPRRDAASEAVHVGARIGCVGSTGETSNACAPAVGQQFATLTLAEHRVLSALADGLCDKAIARRLGISHLTAKDHVYNLMGKLDVHSRLQAVLKALRIGLLRLEDIAC